METYLGRGVKGGVREKNWGYYGQNTQYDEILKELSKIPYFLKANAINGK